MKRSGGGVSCQSREETNPPLTHHHIPSLVCSGCCSGDTATGSGPDCRNISCTLESRIAGKDNEIEREGGVHFS